MGIIFQLLKIQMQQSLYDDECMHDFSFQSKILIVFKSFKFSYFSAFEKLGMLHLGRSSHASHHSGRSTHCCDAGMAPLSPLYSCTPQLHRRNQVCPIVPPRPGKDCESEQHLQQQRGRGGGHASNGQSPFQQACGDVLV